MISAYDPSLFLPIELATQTNVFHGGTCGYECLAVHLGKSNWLEICSIFVANKNHAYFDKETKQRIRRLEKAISVIRSSDDVSEFYLDDNCYLTTQMSKYLVNII
jgi:hypothetical protein